MVVDLVKVVHRWSARVRRIACIWQVTTSAQENRTRTQFHAICLQHWWRIPCIKDRRVNL